MFDDNELPPGHVGIGEGPCYNAIFRGEFNGNMLQRLYYELYKCCWGPHCVGEGTSCQECVENGLINSLLGLGVGATAPEPPLENDMMDRWFEIREVSPDSGRGVTPFEDATGFRTTGQSGSTFGNV